MSYHEKQAEFLKEEIKLRDPSKRKDASEVYLESLGGESKSGSGSSSSGDQMAPPIQEALSKAIKRQYHEDQGTLLITSAGRTKLANDIQLFRTIHYAEIKDHLRTHRNFLIKQGIDYNTIGKLIELRSDSLVDSIEKAIHIVFPYNIDDLLAAKGFKKIHK